MERARVDDSLLCLFLSNLVATTPRRFGLDHQQGRKKKHDSFVQANVSRSHRRDLFNLLIAMCWLGHDFFPTWHWQFFDWWLLILETGGLGLFVRFVGCWPRLVSFAWFCILHFASAGESRFLWLLGAGRFRRRLEFILLTTSSCVKFWHINSPAATTPYIPQSETMMLLSKSSLSTESGESRVSL